MWQDTQKWSRRAEMDQTCRNGPDMKKWIRHAEMDQTCRNGPDMQKWTRHAEMDQICLGVHPIMYHLVCLLKVVIVKF